MICTHDRHSECFNLLQSLLNQSFTEWDLILVDQSTTPIMGHYLFNEIVYELKKAGHKVRFARSQLNGVVANRNQCFMIQEKEFPDAKYSVRIDDDSVCDKHYLDRLYCIISKDDKIGAVGGVVPVYGQPSFKRNIKLVKPTFNKIEFKEDKLLIADDGGWQYTEELILPSHHLRSSFMINNKAAKEIGYLDSSYGGSGFREETDFCLKLIEKGYKLFTDTGALCWHLHTPSGGCRIPNYLESVQICESYFQEKWNRKFREGKMKL